MYTLDELGIKHGTDKASVYPYMHRMFSLDEYIHDYLRHYQIFFEKLRDERFELIEIGVLEGNSLRMWKEYFPKATIVGIDINTECKKHEEERIAIHTVDGASEDCADLIKRTYQRPLIIIDDGGHTWKMQQQSLERLFSVVASGGYYVLEDILSYSNKYDSAEPDGVAQNITDYLFDRIRYLSVASRPDQKLEMLRRMSPASRYITENLDSAYFMNCTCILGKSGKIPSYTVDIAGKVFAGGYLLRNDQTLSDAVTQLLFAHGVKAVVVADGAGRYEGLLTAVDVVRCVKAGVDTKTPLSEIANRNATRLPDFSDAAYAEAQSRTGYKTFPVVDGQGKALGIKYALERDF